MTIALAALTAACGGVDPEPAAPEPAAQPAQPQVALVPQLLNVEVGRMHRGIALTAFGQAPTGGWSAAQLRPRSPGPGPDGWFEVDMVAQPPQDGMQTQVLTRLRADLQIPMTALAGARGLRVHARDGALTVTFGQ
jgi:hypothetical protein